MKKHTLRVILMLVALMTLFSDLFGCGKPQKVHTMEDLTALSISHAQMERTQCYSFCAYLEKERWFWDAQCFLSEEEEVLLEKCPLSSEQLEELFSILRETDVLTQMESSKKKKRLPFSVKDEETSALCLTFSDSTQTTLAHEQPELKQFFYRLAETHSA